MNESIASRGMRLAAACFAILIAGSTPVLAAADPAVFAAIQSSATISGAVKTPSGSPLPGVKVAVEGPTSASAITDASGNFAIPVAPGIYSITATKGGFTTASVGNIVVAAGQSEPLAVTMSAADLTSLRTIGSVTASGRTSAIYTGTATQTYLPAEAFKNLADPLINDVLQRIPEVTIQHLGTQPDSTIIVGGSQPYETQVLFDGHPIALGQFGVWTSQYYPSYLIGGAEVQSGPGNTTPFANLAVGGTVNLLSPGFTKKTMGQVTFGTDNYGSQYSDLLASGSAGNLGYVVGLGTAGSNGRWFQKQGCSVSIDFNAPVRSGIVSFCGDMSGSLYTKGSVFKLKYDFVPGTSLDVGFLGAWGGYSPQGTAPGWGLSWGPTLVEGCSGLNFCTNPANSNLIGTTINGFTWYPGTRVYNNQTLFDAQFRTNFFGNNTLLIRPYLGNIEPEIIDGTDEGRYPQFFGQPPGTPGYQPPSCPSGTPVPNCAPLNTNPNSGNNFETSACPPGTIYSYSQINSTPANTVVDVNGQQECFQYPYTTFEQDKLYGTTFSLIHPFGESSATLTYDYHGQSVFAYFNVPQNISVPFTANRYSTFSLTGDIKLAKSLRMNVGLYNTQWTISGVQPLLDSTGAPVLDSFGSPVLTGLGISRTRFDPHVAFVFHPERSLSVRAAWGTSTTFPFPGQVSGTAAYQPYASSAPLYTAGILVEKNPNLAPETSTAYSLGFDKNLGGNSRLSLDLQNTVIHNVFQSVITATPVAASNCPGLPPPCLEGISAPINVALLQTKLALLKFSHEPAVGFGYNLSAAAESSIVSGVPLSAYNSSPGFPADNVQLCGNGQVTPGTPTCIPYLKGYAQLVYHGAGKEGFYGALGIDYEGKNNAYFQAPLALLDLTLRQPFGPNIDLQVSVQNLLNTNAYNGLVAPLAGTPVVAQTNTGQTSYLPTLIPAPDRTVRMQITFHTGH